MKDDLLETMLQLLDQADLKEPPEEEAALLEALGASTPPLKALFHAQLNTPRGRVKLIQSMLRPTRQVLSAARAARGESVNEPVGDVPVVEDVSDAYLKTLRRQRARFQILRSRCDGTEAYDFTAVNELLSDIALFESEVLADQGLEVGKA